jgi:ATP-dependent DNA ligase
VGCNGGVQQPVDLPLEPMLAKAVDTVPAADSVKGGLVYEPKWDGFRCVVVRDGDEVELESRGSRPLTRYFPEVVDDVRRLLPSKCVIDAEIVVRSGQPGQERLQWEHLSQRIHPAESRIRKLAKETPAELVCFDLLALGDESLLDKPFRERRERLEKGLANLTDGDPIHLTQVTTSASVAQEWFEQFEGAGLDGIVAKPQEQPYAPGKRTMLKVKHSRTADAVVYGYRIHKSGEGVGSLLLGLYTDVDGEDRLVGVGGIAAFTMKRRLELVDEFQPLVVRDESGKPVAAETDRSRFSSAKDVSYVPVRPERVVEVAFDQMEGSRFRHAVTFLRWRPDREPTSCRLDQVDRAPAYDLAEVLTNR